MWVSSLDGGFCKVYIFIKLKKKLNKETRAFPQGIFMVKLTMTLRTIRKELLFELFIA